MLYKRGQLDRALPVAEAKVARMEEWPWPCVKLTRPGQQNSPVTGGIGVLWNDCDLLPAEGAIMK